MLLALSTWCKFDCTHAIDFSSTVTSPRCEEAILHPWLPQEGEELGVQGEHSFNSGLNQQG